MSGSTHSSRPPQEPHTPPPRSRRPAIIKPLCFDFGALGTLSPVYSDFTPTSTNSLQDEEDEAYPDSPVQTPTKSPIPVFRVPRAWGGALYSPSGRPQAPEFHPHLIHTGVSYMTGSWPVVSTGEALAHGLTSESPTIYGEHIPVEDPMDLDPPYETAWIQPPNASSTTTSSPSISRSPEDSEDTDDDIEERN
ncbi:hypothetical protein BDZ91DRAFT_787461 [Kalaharituber pfeilii]|nr:hypothetical protein BDZ91DRAFT_787461 [Kalaharituber pfeilii]